MDMKKEADPNPEIKSFSLKAMIAVGIAGLLMGVVAKEQIDKKVKDQSQLVSCNVSIETTEKDGQTITTVKSEGTQTGCESFLNSIQQQVQSDDAEDAPCDPTAASDAAASSAQ